MPDNLKEFWIHANIMQSGRIMGFRKKNAIEAVLIGVLTKIIFGFLNEHFIHFVTKVEVIVTIGLVVGLSGLALHGIKGMSISEIIMNYVFSKKTAHVYLFRTVDKSRRDATSEAAIIRSNKINETYGEKAINFIKTKIQKFRE